MPVGLPCFNHDFNKLSTIISMKQKIRFVHNIYVWIKYRVMWWNFNKFVNFYFLLCEKCVSLHYRFCTARC